MTNTIAYPEKVRKWERISEAVAIVLSIISLCFTVRLMRSFATDKTSLFLYMAFGGSIQIAQNCLGVYAGYLNMTRQNGKALIAFTLFCLLFTLSLAGTLGSFIVSNKIQNNQEMTSDVRLQELQKRADSLDDQIARSQDLIAGYQARKLLTKGAIPEGQRLDRLNKERTELSEQMLNFKTEGTSDSLYAGLSKLLGMDPEDCKLTLFSMYAVALDLVAATLLAFSIGVLGGQTETGHRQVSGMSENYEPRMTPETAFQMSGKSPETAHHQNMGDEKKTPVRTGTEVRKQPIGFIQNSDTRKPTGRADLNQKTVKNPGRLVSSDIFREYLNTAYKGQDKPTSLMGRRKVADAIGINNDMSDLIHNWLKRKKIVVVDKSRTIPRLTLSEALARVA